MEINNDTRFELIKYALSDYHLKFEYSDSNNIGYIVAKHIIEKSHYSILRQMEQHDFIRNNNFNKLIHHCLDDIEINDNYYNNQRIQLLELLQVDAVGKYSDADNISCEHDNDIKLIRYCNLYLEMKQAKQNREADIEDNDIASDSFLFEKTIKKVAEDTFGKRNITQKLKGVDGIGQALISDTIIKSKHGYIIVDAKFYGTTISYYSHGKLTYKHQSNRYEMNGYITQLRYNTADISKITGVIVHATDSDKYDALNHGSMNIGDNHIYLEFVDITRSANDIIQQIKDIISKYNM